MYSPGEVGVDRFTACIFQVIVAGVHYLPSFGDYRLKDSPRSATARVQTVGIVRKHIVSYFGCDKLKLALGMRAGSLPNGGKGKSTLSNPQHPACWRSSQIQPQHWSGCEDVGPDYFPLERVHKETAPITTSWLWDLDNVQSLTKTDIICPDLLVGTLCRLHLISTIIPSYKNSSLVRARE